MLDIDSTVEQTRITAVSVKIALVGVNNISLCTACFSQKSAVSSSEPSNSIFRHFSSRSAPLKAVGMALVLVFLLTQIARLNLRQVSRKVNDKLAHGFALKKYSYLTNVNTLYYRISMEIEWNCEKNRLLKETRNVSFEEVLAEIKAGRFAGPEKNPAREGQKRIIVSLHGYPFAVPFVETENGGWFLKTIYPCRKLKGRI